VPVVIITLLLARPVVRRTMPGEFRTISKGGIHQNRAETRK